MLDRIIDFVIQYGAYFAGASVLVLIFSLVISLYVIASLPNDYWLTRFENPKPIALGSPIFYLRNLAALVLLLVGFILLFMPGQGLLTILIAIIVSQSPYKNAMAQGLIGNHNIQQGLNTMRAWMKKDPFIFPPD